MIMLHCIFIGLLFASTGSPARAQPYGGKIYSNKGKLELEPASSNCLWIITLENKLGFMLELDSHMMQPIFVIPQRKPPDTDLQFVSMNASRNITYTFEGKTLAVFVLSGYEKITMNWTGLAVDKSGVSYSTTYMTDSVGRLEWEHSRNGADVIFWGFDNGTTGKFHWKLDTVLPACDEEDPCDSISLAVLQFSTHGNISVIQKTFCEGSSNGTLNSERNSQVLVLLYINSPVEAKTSLQVTWEHDDEFNNLDINLIGTSSIPKPSPTTADGLLLTTSPTTEPPGATGLFAATSTGLISLDLRTLEATFITSVDAEALAVNNKLNKVYWSEYPNGIRRSNFDGSSKENIVPSTGAKIRMLTIDEPFGNLYFSRQWSNEITVCSALGENCAAVISDSHLVNNPVGAALDSANGVMYWGGDGSPIVRANLDGSNAAIISTACSTCFGITLDPRLNGVLYWTDYQNDTIGTIDVNGENQRTLLKLEGEPGPYGIQVDFHKIYIGYLDSNNIQTADRDSGKELTTIFNSTGRVRQLAFFDAPA